MEEQKKKRVRATWRQVRALEKELAEVKEQYRLQLQADKYLSEEIQLLKGKINTLEQSNQLMEEEMNRVKRDRDHLSSLHSKLSIENLRLKTRGFFARVFNVF